MKTAFCLGLAAALTLTSAALAGDEGPGHRDRGARADTNGDGRVTLEESQAALKARMARLDADRDGRITKAEMDGARTQFAERRRERFDERGRDAFAIMDTDRNGQLSPQEFEAGRQRMAERRHERREGRMTRRGHVPGERFDRLDADNDGVVTSAEMDRAVAERFARMDADKDGAISADERPERRRGRHR